MTYGLALLVAQAAPAAVAPTVPAPVPALTIALPDTVDGLPGQAAAGNPLDQRRAYQRAGETVSIYLFRATYPNARLWFDRADEILGALASFGPMQPGSAPEALRFGGSATPNAMYRSYAVREGGRAKSTALAVGQAGPWIVKVRSTSRSLSAADQRARVIQALNAVRLSGPPPAPLPLVAPEPCPEGAHSVFDSLEGDPVKTPGREAIARAALAAAAVAREAAGRAPSVATDPQAYCRQRLINGDAFAALFYRKDTAMKDWVMLVADSGTSVASRTLPPSTGKRDEARASVVANTLVNADVLLLTKGPPMPEAALGVALPYLVQGQGSALASVPLDPPGDQERR